MSGEVKTASPQPRRNAADQMLAKLARVFPNRDSNCQQYSKPGKRRASQFSVQFDRDTLRTRDAPCRRFSLMPDEAARLDAANPLARFRDEFYFPNNGPLYFDGNSLGC
jgi:hypothetical protein